MAKDTGMKVLPLENIEFKVNELSIPRLDKDHSVIIDWLKNGFECDYVNLGQQVQSLWSGYGEIVKFNLMNNKAGSGLVDSVVVKWVNPPSKQDHPRGWQSDLAHQRKLTSYQVEMNVYLMLNQVKKSTCRMEGVRVPHYFYGHYNETNQQQLLILEDLDKSGFPLRHARLTPRQAEPCILWLARFHAYFLRDTYVQKELPEHLELALSSDNTNRSVQGLSRPFGLWPIGSYWHLGTRPEEWQAMAESELKERAEKLNDRLNSLRFQTLIHGDAKVANFCFSAPSSTGRVDVAALDFQYTGQGCGMKDFVYFLGSCLTETECEKHWRDLLNLYFSSLIETLKALKTQIDIVALESEWRFAFEFAWADFQRFLEGWSPDHKKNTAFSRALTANALNKLDA